MRIKPRNAVRAVVAALLIGTAGAAFRAVRQAAREGLIPAWGQGPGSPEEQMLRSHRLNWKIMLELGLQPGQETTCLVVFGAKDQTLAEQLAASLRASGLSDIETRANTFQFIAWTRWSVHASIVVPAISREAMDAAGRTLLALAEPLHASFSGLLPLLPEEPRYD